MDAFQRASYAKRGELLCLRMVRKRVVNGATFLLSDPQKDLEGGYTEPNEELTFERFARSLAAHAASYT